VLAPETIPRSPPPLPPQPFPSALASQWLPGVRSGKTESSSDAVEARSSSVVRLMAPQFLISACWASLVAKPECKAWLVDRAPDTSVCDLDSAFVLISPAPPLSNLNLDVLNPAQVREL